MSNSVNIYEGVEPIKKEKIKKAKKPFSKKKKVIISIISIILVIALIISGIAVANSKKSSSSSYAYIRTTTLSKGTLENSISATGTVNSAETSNVTTSLNYTVKSILVSVGDEVSVGDTICTLDTSELEEQIEREKSNLSKTLENAQSSYDSALSNYNKAKAKLESSKTDLSDAKTEKNSAYTPYKNAKSAISSYQSAYDKALKNYNNAGAEYVEALNNYNSAISKYKNNKISADKLISVSKKYMTAVQNYYGACSIGNYDISEDTSSSSSSQNMQGSMGGSGTSTDSAVSVSRTANDICNDTLSTVLSLTGKSITYSSGANTLLKLSNCASSLKQAKASCNYSSLESAYTTANSQYETAKQNYEQCESSYEQFESQLTQAKSQLSSASSSDTLEELQSQLSECVITANQAGTITSLNATVGSTASGSGGMSAGGSNALATISNLDKLKISITIAEADINNAIIGMSCYITSDASDETINGTLTQIDPTASDSGSFGAEVTVDSDNTSLKVGMNASVELLVSAKDDVYQVPIDAIGNDDNGDFVYRKTSGEGVDMEFEKVYVTTGEQNDYYTEISSDSLSEGDVIRSSSNLEEGIETGETSNKENNNSFNLFGGMQGGGNREMGGGDMQNKGNRPDMQSPPSGNGFSGGGANG